jgi:hypothetical protein
MDKNLRIVALILLVVGIAVSAGALQVFAYPKLDQKEIQQQLKDSISFAKEEQLIIDQAVGDKIPQTYTQTQTSHINTKLLEFYQNLDTLKVDDDQKVTVQKIEPVIFQLVLELKTVESNPDDKQKLSQVKSQISKTQKTLEDLLQEEGGNS